MPPRRTVHTDIIQGGNDPDKENAFFEKYDARKKRIKAEKEREKNGHERRIGRPRSITADVEKQIIIEFLRFPIQSDTARKFGVDRKSVFRILTRNGINPAEYEQPKSRRTNYAELRLSIDLPLYKKIQSIAKLRNRTVGEELRAALTKLYDR